MSERVYRLRLRTAVAGPNESVFLKTNICATCAHRTEDRRGHAGLHCCTAWGQNPYLDYPAEGATACTNIQDGINGKISGRIRNLLIRIRIAIQVMCDKDPPGTEPTETAFIWMHTNQQTLRIKELETKF